MGPALVEVADSSKPVAKDAKKQVNTVSQKGGNGGGGARGDDRHGIGCREMVGTILSSPLILRSLSFGCFGSAAR